MKRITAEFIDAQVDLLNKLQNMPASPYERVDGKNVAQPGCYYRSGAYGGHSLERMSEGGGCVDVFRTGHIPAKQLSALIDAYICGIKDANNS